MQITTITLLVIIGIIVLVVVLTKKGCVSCREGISWRISDCNPPRLTEPGTWYEYHNPSVRAEQTYWNDAYNLDLPCGDGIYLLEGARLNAFKRGYKDHADYVCEGQGLIPGTQEYTRCLTEVYSDYKYP